MSDLKIQVLGLLQFIEDSLLEGLKHPLTLAECLSEADCALRILRKLLEKDEMMLALFQITPLSHFHFFIAGQQKTAAEKEDSINKCLKFVSATRALLCDPPL